MNEGIQTAYGFGGVVSTPAQRNRVLRNTYALLALSMIPTVLGAWLGVSTGIMARMGTGMSVILFLAGAFGFMFAIEKFKNSALGVGLLGGSIGLAARRAVEPHLLGHRLTAVAGEAGDTGVGDVLLPVDVDVLGHLNHPTRHHLGVLGVFCKVGRVVAIQATLLWCNP